MRAGDDGALTWQPGDPVALKTKSYTLRSMGPDDITDRYITWAKDPELMENLNAPARLVNRTQLKRYIKSFDNRTKFHLGVFTAPEGVHIGFFTIYVDAKNRSAQTNVVIGDRDYWGKGVVLEARGAILDFLFDVVGVAKIWGTPFERNFPSIFNYKAQGFTCEGVLRKQVINMKGKRVDQYIFGLLREEWHARRAQA